MSILTDMQKIIDACYPTSQDESQRLWREIKPVRFGDQILWQQDVNGSDLVAYQIPEDADYLAILRTECYVFTNDTTDPGFRTFEPPPDGTVQWVIKSGAGIEPLTGLVRPYLLADVEEFLIVKAGLQVALRGVLAVPPTTNRQIRTTVYGYHVSALIADRIGSNELINRSSI